MGVKRRGKKFFQDGFGTQKVWGIPGTRRENKIGGGEGSNQGYKEKRKRGVRKSRRKKGFLEPEKSGGERTSAQDGNVPALWPPTFRGSEGTWW